MFTPMLPVAWLSAPAPSIAVPSNEPRKSTPAVCDDSSVATMAALPWLRETVDVEAAMLLFCTLLIPDATFTPTLPDAYCSEPSPTEALTLKFLMLALPPELWLLKTWALPNTLPASTEASAASLLCALLTPSAMLTPMLPLTFCAALLPVVAVRLPAFCVLMCCVTEPYTSTSVFAVDALRPHCAATLSCDFDFSTS